MEAIEVIQGWNCEQSQFMNSACANTQADDVDMYFETSVLDGSRSLSITIRGGYGYETYTAGATVPVEVLVRMLRHAGYEVTAPVQDTPIRG